MTDIDTWALENSFERFTNAIPDEVWTANLEGLADVVQEEIDNLEAWVTPAAPGIDPTALIQYVGNLQTKLRMGTYSEALDGSLTEVLDEIERLLR